MYPENTIAVLLTNVSWSLWPPVTFANGAVSSVAGNLDVVVISLPAILPWRTWYINTPDRSRGFRVSSVDLGFLAINRAKASLDGASMVMFWATERVWTISGTVCKRLVRVLRVALLLASTSVSACAETQAVRLSGSR